MKYFIFLFGILLPACATQTTIRSGNILTKDEYAVIDLGSRYAICERAIRYSCGLRLSVCHDKLKYECVTDAVILNVKDLPSGNAIEAE